MSKDPLFTVWDSTELERDLALMDRVKLKFNLPSDKELAKWLGVNKTIISGIRAYAKTVEQMQNESGATTVSDLPPPPRSLTSLQRLRAFDRLGYAWARDALMTAFPDSVREDLRKIDNERAKANFREAHQEPKKKKMSGTGIARSGAVQLVRSGGR